MTSMKKRIGTVLVAAVLSASLITPIQATEVPDIWVSANLSLKQSASRHLRNLLPVHSRPTKASGVRREPDA